jgi:Flp pilus assembly protein TadG
MAMLTKNQKGAVAIEMAIVTLFILVPLLLGTIDLAIAIYNQQVLTNASREGARAGIARSAISVETVVQNYCANRLIPSGSSPAVSEAGGGAFQNDYAVSVTYEHHFMFAGIIGLPATKTLTGRTVMKMEPLPPS